MSLMANVSKATTEQVQELFDLIDREDEAKRLEWNKYHREWRRAKMEDVGYRDNERLKKRTYKQNVKVGRIIPKTRKPQEHIILEDETLKEFATTLRTKLERMWGKKVYKQLQKSGELDTMFYEILKDPYKYDIGDYRLDVNEQNFRLSAY